MTVFLWTDTRVRRTFRATNRSTRPSGVVPHRERERAVGLAWTLAPVRAGEAHMHLETRTFRRWRVIAGAYLVAALISSGIRVVAASRAVMGERGNRAVGAVSSCSTAATFQGLGDLPGGSVESWAYAVSPDGSVVVGSSSSSSGQQAFRWTSGQGMVGLGYLPGTGQSEATSASAGT